jgi:hydrogenase-4 transcriptional activator
MTNPLLVRELADHEKQLLEHWLISDDSEKARRAKVILLSASGKTALEISHELGFHPDNLKKWIRKFNQIGFAGIEIKKRGPQIRFTEKEIQQVLKVYAQSPQQWNLPFNYWTPQKLADFLVRQGIMKSISHVTVRQIIQQKQDIATTLPVTSPNITAASVPMKFEAHWEPAPKSSFNSEPTVISLPDWETDKELSNSNETAALSLSELIARSKVLLQQGNGEQSYPLLQLALKQSVGNPELEAQARCYLNESQEILSDYEAMLATVILYEENNVLGQLSVKHRALVKLRLGWAYSRLANYAKAIARFNEARRLFIELDDEDGLGAVHYALGFVYIEINESHLAREYLLKALENLPFTTNNRLLARVYIDLGLVNYKEGDFESTETCYLKAREYATNTQDPDLIGLIAMNLGAVCVDYGKREQATRYFQQAVGEFRKGKQKTRLALAYNNLGNNLLRGGSWTEAASCLNQALELARSISNQEDTWLTLITLGELYFLQGEFERAEVSLLEAIKLLTEDETGDKWAEAYAWRALGRLYDATNAFDKAIQALRSSLQLATKTGNLYEVGLCHLALAEHHILQKSYDQADEYLGLAEENFKVNRDLDLAANGWLQRLMGKVALARSNYEEAKQRLSASINIFASINEQYELATSKLELGLVYMQLGEQHLSQENFLNAQGQFAQLGAKAALQRTNQFLIALQTGEPPQLLRVSTEVRLARDVLLMQRLIEAASSRDLLLKELVTIVYENFDFSQVVILGTSGATIEPLMSLQDPSFDPRNVLPEITKAIALGESKVKDNAFLYLLEERASNQLWIYCEARNKDGLTTITRLRPLLKQAELVLENCALRMLTRGSLTESSDKLRVQSLIPGFIYASPAMQDVVERIRKIRTSDTTVLITGESGTGKELIARAIHAESSRRDAIFLPFNCTATPKELIESQLFGHRRGAFTGATSNYPGIIRAADGGTLFLDEIGDLSLEVQPKLLRFLEAGEIQPLGETKPMKVDVRVLAATNAMLEKAVEDGRFREDLLYRLNIIRIQVPPLRERREEIPPLVSHYLKHFINRSGKKNITLSHEVLEYLSEYFWPGNIRQLRTEIERLIAYTSDNKVIVPDDLSPEIVRFHPTHAKTSVRNEGRALPEERVVVAPMRPNTQTLRDATEKLEKELIEDTLRRTQYNISQTARELGLSRRGLKLKMIQLGLE